MRRRSPLLHLSLAAAVSAVGLFAASPALAGSDHVRAGGALVRYAALPTDATARVHALYDSSGDSRITLHVRGLEPNTRYGAHAHVNTCGLQPGDAGGHFQNAVNPDPAYPTDPAYANPQNEIWLDFETNAAGNAVATAEQGWQFSPTRRAGSVIIHAEPTKLGPPGAGTAGARLACLAVAF